MTHISVIVEMAQYVPKTDGEFKGAEGNAGIYSANCLTEVFLNVFIKKRA